MHNLVFDWGNTLMRTYPQFSGPMADWPQVDLVPGISDALEKISKDHKIFIATSAQDSNADQVKKALARAGIEKYFQDIFTFEKIGISKDTPDFYSRLDKLIGGNQKPVMIGDNYYKDITNATLAGWPAIWYSIDAKPCPALLPLHLAEIVKMEVLSDKLNNLVLPDYLTAVGWLIGNHSNSNLLLHSQTVAAVSYLLSVWIRNCGNQVDPVIAHRGGLLHDIAKLSDRNPNDFEIDHAELGSRLLLEKRQPILADIARSHLISSLYDDSHRPETWEQKLVHYADKIVEGASVVMLEERIQAICKRYPHHAERILGSVSGVKQMQAEICQHLDLSPDQLQKKISAALMGSIEEE